jgi:hypothetical protein
VVGHAVVAGKFLFYDCLIRIKLNADVGTREALIEMFKNNEALLNNIPTQNVDTFINLLITNGRDDK